MASNHPGAAHPWAKHALRMEDARNLAQGRVVLEKDEIQIQAARLFGQGYSVAQVARIMVNHLSPRKDRTHEKRLIAARSKLKRWMKAEDPWFRNLVYENAVVKLDLESPKILMGVSKRAQRGNIQAA